jgi:DNA-binding response OmpR family regulator
MQLDTAKKRPVRAAASTEPKCVLILEDDEELKSIVQEYLEANGYSVAAVTNGVAGLREVLARNFDAIICDMLMPSLPGDMFYMAVERTRPHLCPRFIFVTGQQNNAKVIEFIRRIRGTMLPKPFRMDDLLEQIYGVQLKISEAA